MMLKLTIFAAYNAPMIVVTGTSKNPGRAMSALLRSEGFRDIVEPPAGDDALPLWVEQEHRRVQIILDFASDEAMSQALWRKCITYGLPCILVQPCPPGGTPWKWITGHHEKPYFWADIHYAPQAEDAVPDVVLQMMLQRKESGSFMINQQGINQI
jgi:hypothetical protein